MNNNNFIKDILGHIPDKALEEQIYPTEKIKIIFCEKIDNDLLEKKKLKANLEIISNNNEKSKNVKNFLKKIFNLIFFSENLNKFNTDLREILDKFLENNCSSDFLYFSEEENIKEYYLFINNQQKKTEMLILFTFFFEKEKNKKEIKIYLNKNNLKSNNLSELSLEIFKENKEKDLNLIKTFKKILKNQKQESSSFIILQEEFQSLLEEFINN